MTKKAQCQCGALVAEVSGGPSVVVLCNRSWCQRRSGSEFGTGAYYKRENVTTSGEHREFVRPGGSLHPFTRGHRRTLVPADGRTP